MARKPDLNFTKTPRGWLINVPPSLSATGKRERLYFDTRDQAKEHAQKLRHQVTDHGTQAKAIRPALAESATQAEEMLRPLGITLLDAIKRFVEIETRNRASVTMDEAVLRFQTSGTEWSDSQARAYRLRGEKLLHRFANRMIATISGEELTAHLEETSGGPGAFNQAVRLVRTLWRWCAKPPRKWCDIEAIQHLEPKTVISDEIGILTPDQARALLTAAEEHLPDCIAPFAIGLFTGLRQAEIARLKPCDVTAEGINLPAANDRKNNRRRFIAMPEPLADWLQAYPITDYVCPPNWKRKEIAVRRIAGFKVWSNHAPRIATISPRVTADPPPDLTPWPDNALRHTAASVAVALGKPLEQLIFEHGHSGGVTMLKRHYLGAITKAQAVAIWTLRPNGKTAEILAIAAI